MRAVLTLFQILRAPAKSLHLKSLPEKKIAPQKTNINHLEELPMDASSAAIAAIRCRVEDGPRITNGSLDMKREKQIHIQVPVDLLPVDNTTRANLRERMSAAHLVNERVFFPEPRSSDSVEVVPDGTTFEVRVLRSKRRGTPTRLYFVTAANRNEAAEKAIQGICIEQGLAKWSGMTGTFALRLPPCHGSLENQPLGVD